MTFTPRLLLHTHLLSNTRPGHRSPLLPPFQALATLFPLRNFSASHPDSHQHLQASHQPSSAPERKQHDHPEAQADFGFRQVPESMKESLVGQVFDSVASSYDIMNDFMSLGIHRLWKDQFVKAIDPRGPINCLDLAGGTGDIAFRLLDHARLAHSDRQVKVKVMDINPKMLQEGMKKYNRSIYYGGDQLEFQVGNAQNLKDHVKDNSIDLYTIAFGIRNCTNIEAVLREAYRVLKKGGRFNCLEFGKVSNPVLSSLYEAYSFNVIPNIGHIVAGDRDSYQYLVESIRKFPDQATFARMIHSVGFHLPYPNPTPWQDLSFGIAAIHSGFKL